MENFILFLINFGSEFLSGITAGTLQIIGNILATFNAEFIIDTQISLVLFSDTPIITLPAAELITLFFSIFYTVIFIVIVYKIVKKVFVKITRWNKW